MSSSKRHAWVTHALNEDEGIAALVMAKSFRKANTSASIAIFIDPNLSSKIRRCISTTFDFVFVSKEDELWGKLKDEYPPGILTFLYFLGMTCFDKCILLPPASLAIQDPDKLFSSWNLSKSEVDLSRPLCLKPLGNISKEQLTCLVDNLKDKSVCKEGLLEKLFLDLKLNCFSPNDCFASIGVKSTENIGPLANDGNLSVVYLTDAKSCEDIYQDGSLSKDMEVGYKKNLYVQWRCLFKNELKQIEKAKSYDSPSLGSEEIIFKSISDVEPIAIVGMSCRVPGANDLNEFWDMLKNGKCVVGPVPDHRWTKEQHPWLPPGLDSVQAGFVLNPIDKFDAKFFEISAKEATAIDPQHRLLLEMAWEAMENASINPEKVKGLRGGVFLGTWLNTYKEILEHDNLNADFFRTYTGNCVGAGAHRVSHLFGWTGPSIGIESDCAAGLTCVSLACKSLRSEDCGIALACGVNLIVKPFSLSSINVILSPDYRCKAFDESANGFARAEGAGVLVLKRYSDAVKDADNILGLIRGTAVSQEGTSSSMGTPTVGSQVEAMLHALKDGGVQPSQVSYVEAHGTGTPVGDPVEMMAISKVYGRKVPENEYLTIGSTKNNIGHLESASGVIGVIKVLLSMKHGLIPPLINFKSLNPKINLEGMGAQLPLTALPWPKVSDKEQIAAISAFGIAGKNCHVILEEPPVKEIDKTSRNQGHKRPFHIMKITAKSETALNALLNKYKDCFNKKSTQDLNFKDIAYTANVCKANFKFRAVIVAETIENACEILKSGNFESNRGLSITTGENKDGNSICFLFTGQGCQYQGMGKILYETSPVFRFHFDFCSDWLQSHFSISVKDAYFQDGSTADERIHQTLYSQTGIFIVEYCLSKLWQNWGLEPRYVLGHSLGEYCAAVCAGILTIEDALTLVAKRSLLINRLPEGKMLVIRASKATVGKLQKEFFTNHDEILDYAAFNAEDQTVVAGYPKSVKKFQQFLESKGTKSTLLQSTHAFHSRSMDPILEEFASVAGRVRFMEPVSGINFVSGMLGKVLDKVDAHYWVDHTREPVNFLGACDVLLNEMNCSTFLEIGPHPVLSGLLMLNSKENKVQCLPSLRKGGDDWKTTFQSLGKIFTQEKININWEGVCNGLNWKKVGHLLPNYPFDGTRFWPQIHSTLQVFSEHPLLGNFLPNASKSTIFQSEIAPTEKLEYLTDHKLGDMIILPGAGYIEMMLAAGGSTAFGGNKKEFTQPSRPIQLTEVRIQAPLELQEGIDRVRCQIILNKMKTENNESVSQIRIFHNKSSSNWIKNATANFYLHNNSSIVNNETSEELEELQSHYLKYRNKESNLALFTSVKENSKPESLQNTFYKRYATCGLNLGPAFQTLSTVWKTNESLLAEVDAPSDWKNYLLHPTLIDGMIQAAAFPSFWKTNKQPQLMVPIGCKRFVWIQSLETKGCYIYSPNTNSNTTFLFDTMGNLIALLYKLEVAETRVENIRAIINPSSKSLPDFYNTTWEKYDSFFGFDFSLAKDAVDIAKEQPKTVTLLTPDEIKKNKDINRLATLFVTKALINLGWEKKKGARVLKAELASKLNIAKAHYRLFMHFLTFPEEDGLLVKPTSREEDEWIENAVTLPSIEKIKKEVDSILGQNSGEISTQSSGTSDKFVQILLLCRIGENFDKFLLGKESVLNTLHPKSSFEISAEQYYEIMFSKIKVPFSRVIKVHLKELQMAYKRRNESFLTTRLRVLEIGAGTGAITGLVLESLEEAEISFEYVYTDISATFFSAAEQKFQKYKTNMIFSKLNIEEDPLNQGFPPQYFDVVIASHVVHATRDIKESLGNIRNLMKNGGNLWLSETIGKDRMTDCVFGPLEGFWRFTDIQLRPNHCMLSAEKWEIVTREIGFSDFNCISDDDSNTYGLIVCRAYTPDCNGSANKTTYNYGNGSRVDGCDKAWVIFYTASEEPYVTQLLTYLKGIGRDQVILVKVSREDKQVAAKPNFFCINPTNLKSFCELELAKIICKAGSASSFSKLEGIIVTWGLSEDEHRQENLVQPYLSILQFLAKLPAAETPPCVLLTSGQYPVGNVSCLNPSPSTLIGMSITALNENKNLKLRIMDLDPRTKVNLSIWRLIQEVFSNYRKETPFVSVFRGESILRPKEKAQKKNNQSLSLPSGSDRFEIELPSSKAIDDLKFKHLRTYELESDEIEVKVLFTALNFRDLLSVLRPNEFFETYNSVGMDFSGIVTQVGPAIKNFKIGDEVFGLNLSHQHLPSHYKIKEKCLEKVPSGFTLAEASCLPVAFATAYHSIINLAKAEKGESILIHSASGGVGLLAIQIAKHLGLQIICTAGSERKRNYLKSLGIQNVYNSRSLQFSKDILNLTDNKGVDIVLNSLTGPGFIKATIEACSKTARFVELSKLNIWSSAEVAEVSPHVNYIILGFFDLEAIVDEGSINERMLEWMKDKIRSIPYIRFDVEDVKDALKYLHETKQIGRVVCQMPPFLEHDKLYDGPTGKISTPLFNDRSSYLITGGLGGIGLEVCKYMVQQGARHLLLMGRSPPGNSTLKVLDILRKYFNCKIFVVEGDVGKIEDCAKAIELAESSGLPLRGVMHAAGTLSDKMMENLDWSDFQKTFQSKVEGTWNLHELTKKLPLEHFVLFSSFASNCASSGQATHVAGCFFQDTFTHFRNSFGLTSTTVNWGQWTEVGVAKNMNITYVLPLSVKQGINSLDFILRKNISSTAVVHFREHLSSIIERYPYMKWVIDKSDFKPKEKQSLDNKSKLNSSSFWVDYEKCLESSEKLKVAKHYVEIMLRIVLRLEAQERITEDADLSIMGMDSLMMIELFNLMQFTCGKRIKISQAAIRECKTLQSLGTRFVEIIEETWKEVEPPTQEEIRELCLEDFVLPEDIKQEHTGSWVDPSEIKSVLFTGATGFVGSHMLKELVESCPQIAKVYCLVRGQEPEKRLRSVLAKNRVTIAEELFKEKIIAISGDCAKPCLDLEENDYLKLSGEVEGILHFGAMVHHYEYYRKIENGTKDIRSVNVGGLLNILRFACKTKTKHLIHTSSLITAWERDEDGVLLESWPTVERLLSFETNMGYPISKMINELHLKEAVEGRGIPCKALRFCQLRASTTSGKSFAEGSHLLQVSIFCLNEGVVPKEPFPINVIPVDVAAKITFQFVFNDKAPNEIYNISHTRPLIISECLAKVAEQLGYRVAPLIMTEFVDRVLKRCEQARKEFEMGGETSTLRKATVFELQTVYQDERLFGFLLKFANATGEGRRKCEDFWVSKKLLKFASKLYSQPESPLETLKRDLQAAIDEGNFNLF